MQDKILYIDCSSGISGDKFVSALYDLSLIKEKEIAEFIGRLNIKDFSYADISFKKVKRLGLAGLFFHVDGRKAKIQFKTVSEINRRIDLFDLKPRIKNDIHLIYDILIEAESAVHGNSFDKLHLHELASIDTVLDISLCAFLISRLKVNDITCSDVNLGSGFIDVAHGRLIVPPPAVSFILKEIPVYSWGDAEELTTPTGAAILKYYAKRFPKGFPAMEIISEGHGCGMKELNTMANVLRVFYGRPLKSDNNSSGNRNDINRGEIYEIKTNIDDMNPEIYDYVIEKLVANGALDVFLTPVVMKKSRPGVLLTILCEASSVEKISNAVLEETSSLGLRISKMDKICLKRRTMNLKTPFGTLGIKVATLNGKVVNRKPEYDELKKIAGAKKIPLKEVYRIVQDCIDKWEYE